MMFTDRAERATHNIRHIYRARCHIDALHVSQEAGEVGISAAEWHSLMDILKKFQARAAAVLSQEIPTDAYD
jgi:hypothetical protein